MSDCDHKYQYAGVRYDLGKWPRAGSGAVNVYYAHVYFCERCLNKRSEPIAFGYEERPSSYGPVLYGATRGTPDESGVPLEDRR
jgi:hypothetical protein